MNLTMNLTNAISLIRSVAAFVFLYFALAGEWRIAFPIFWIAALTDMIDGSLARLLGQRTRLGAFLDPMADKLLLTASFITLTYLKVIPFWITAVVISRDLVLMLGAVLIHMSGGTIHPSPTWLGKASTFFQMLTVLAAMLMVYIFKLPEAAKPFFWITAAFTTASGIQYLYQGTRLLNPPAPREPHEPTLVR